MTTSTHSAGELYSRSAVASWKVGLDPVNKMFDEFSDEDLQREIALGKNRIFYLMGHLAAVHDRMLPLLRLGARLQPELDEEFLNNPDRSRADTLSAAALRQVYAKINTALTNAMEALPPEGWLERHDAISLEDFAKEPLRNRLSVLLNRTSHMQFHAGQVRLAVKK